MTVLWELGYALELQTSKGGDLEESHKIPKEADPYKTGQNKVRGNAGERDDVF